MNKTRGLILEGHYKGTIRNFVQTSNYMKITVANLLKAIIWSFLSYTFIKVHGLKIPMVFC